jgi:hypothetical protein
MSKYPKEELKKRLTPMQYAVTQENSTEPPYKSKHSCIQMNILRPQKKEFTIALYAKNHCLRQRRSLIVGVDGLLSTMRSKRPISPKRLINNLE